MNKIKVFFVFLLLVFLAGCNVSVDTNIPIETNTDTDTGDKNENYDLKIHFIDVGQADSILIQLPNHETILIDAGNNNDADLVVNYIRSQNITKIDYVIGTHPHEDHIGGMDAVIDTFEIGEIYMPAKTSNTQTFLSVLESIEAKDLSITEAKTGVNVFNTTVNQLVLKALIIAPVKTNYHEINDHSAVLKLTYGETSYIFTGDSEEASEHDLVESGINIQADVLKVGHHGSITSSSQEFLDAVNPSIAVISVGLNNSYKHPGQATVDKLEALNAAIYRTDEDGTIIITSNGSKIKVNDNVYDSTPKDEDTSPEPGETTEPEVTEPEEPVVIDGGIVINEFMAAPSSGQTEWVEFYNTTDQAIDLTGYVLDDLLNAGMVPMTLPEGIIIEAKGFYVYDVSGNVFNNGGDDVRLTNAEGELIDVFTYTSTGSNLVWYRTTDGGDWASQPRQEATMGISNHLE
jgi:competence protein ComEC